MVKSWQDIPGWFNFHAVYDEAVASAQDGDKFVEVGCWLGRSTAYLAQKIKESGKDIELWCVDTWKGTPGESNPEMQEILQQEGGNVFGRFMRNMAACGLGSHVCPLPMSSSRAADLFRPASLTFVFIDADHSEAGVLRDMIDWYPRVKPGGVLAGHDYKTEAYPGVTKAVLTVLKEYCVEERPEMCWWHRKDGAV